MENKKPSFATLVATPNQTSWAQAYNSSDLFVILSLFSETESEDEESSLSIAGKEIIEHLEKEFEKLSEKNLNHVKETVKKILGKVPEDIEASLTVALIKDNILYVSGFGEAQVLLKRGDTLGVVFLPKSKGSVYSASGFLETGDVIVLETLQFQKVVSKEELKSAVQSASPSETAENLAPLLHKQDDGRACALIISYEKTIEPQEEDEETIPLEISDPEFTEAEADEHSEGKHFHSPISFSFLIGHEVPFHKLFRIKSGGALSHTRRMFLSVAAILCCILLLSIFFGIKKQTDSKAQAQFQDVYSGAKKKYDEGTALLDLNKNLARDDFLAAQKILLDGKPKFQQGSNEEKQIDQLLSDVNAKLDESSSAFSIKTDVVDPKTSAFLLSELKANDTLFATEDSSNIYLLTGSGISSVDKKNNQEKQIIKKDWTSPAGLGVYLGNLYVVEKKDNQIIKFVQSGYDYSKTQYLSSGVSPDFSNAVALSIDTSLWVLGKDGTIQKFTRGKPDTFNITGLDKQFVNPTRIATSTDFDNVYILDSGNKRIVVLSKENGGYVAQYESPILSIAKDFEVLEKDKKIFVLQGNKVYSLSLP